MTLPAGCKWVKAMGIAASGTGLCGNNQADLASAAGQTPVTVRPPWADKKTLARTGPQWIASKPARRILVHDK